VQREREIQRGSFQRCQMYVTKYYTLVVLALLAAHHIFHISRIKVNNATGILRVVRLFCVILLNVSPYGCLKQRFRASYDLLMSCDRCLRGELYW
jgi:hypothetical protein